MASCKEEVNNEGAGVDAQAGAQKSGEDQVEMRRQGSILIISLWLLVFLAGTALGLRKLAATHLVFCRFYLNRANSQFLSDSAFEKAALERRNDITAGYDSLRELRTKRKIETASGKASYYFIDEESRINANTASRKVLKRLPGVSEGLALEIIDSRQEKKFQITEDLLKVDGIDRSKLYGDDDAPGLAEYLTVCGRGKVNVNTASEEVLFALIGDDNVTERIIEFRRGYDGKDNTEDDRVFSSPRNIIGKLEGISARESLALAEASRLIRVSGETYRIMIEGETKNKGQFRCTAVYAPLRRAVELWREQ